MRPFQVNVSGLDWALTGVSTGVTFENLDLGSNTGWGGKER